MPQVAKRPLWPRKKRLLPIDIEERAVCIKADPLLPFDVGNLPTYSGRMMRFVFVPFWLAVVLVLAACADGAPGTPGTATAHIDGSATFFAGVGGSH